MEQLIAWVPLRLVAPFREEVTMSLPERTNSDPPVCEDRCWSMGFKALVRLILPPLMFLAAGVVLLAILGLAQRTGWLKATLMAMLVLVTRLL